MYLKQVLIKNFRNFNGLYTFNIKDFTTILGKNDIGKSTFLEALDIFFNDSAKGYTQIDKSDLSLKADDKYIEISCIFSDFPKEIDIDAGYKTSLEQEFLLNNNGDLQIVKKYDAEQTRIKPQIFIKAKHPVFPDDIKDLLSLKRNELKDRLALLDLENKANKTINSLMRKTIRDYYIEQTKYQEIEIEVDKEDGRKIYDKIKENLPLFSLFKSDRINSDKEAEIQDPLSFAVKRAVDSKLNEFKNLENQIYDDIKEVAERTIKQLKQFDDTLAEQLKFSSDSCKWESVFKYSLNDEKGISINKRGSGVRRLILLSFFRAELELRKSANNRPVIYAIEEPETSQHPDMQRTILNSLTELSIQDNTQVMITTHSPNFINEVPVNGIIFLKSNNDKVTICENSNNENILLDFYNEIQNELGIVKTNLLKLIILTEGISDIEYLKYFSKIFSEKYKNIKNLNSREDITFIPFGGGNLCHWANLKCIDKICPQGTSVFCLIDGDEKQYVAYCKELLAGIKHGDQHALKRKTIENYIPLSALQKSEQFSSITESDLASIADNTGKLSKILAQYKCKKSGKSWDMLDRNSCSKRYDQIKKILKDTVMPLITLEELEKYNGNEIKEILEKISSYLI